MCLSTRLCRRRTPAAAVHLSRRQQHHAGPASGRHHRELDARRRQPSLTSARILAGEHRCPQRHHHQSPDGHVYNLEVRDTTVKNIYLRGICASSGGTLTSTTNTVQNVQANPASIGMFNFAGMTYRQQRFRLQDAISSNHSARHQLHRQHRHASASGIHSDNAGDAAHAPTPLPTTRSRTAR